MKKSEIKYQLLYRAKELLKRNEYIFELVKRINCIIRNNITKKRNNDMKKNGLEVLKEFDTLLTTNKINYTVFAGTLLGAVREKGFLKHDIDIDTAIFYKDYNTQLVKLLNNAGFILVHEYKIDNGSSGLEQTYKKNGVSIDIFYIYSDEAFGSYQCDFHGVNGELHEVSMIKYGYVESRRLEFPIKYEFVRMPFETIEISAIANYDEWLRYRYGDDYMIPNPEFRDKGDNPNIYEWKRAIMKY